MNAVWTTILGALILLDKYAVGEFGISQPIMAGTVLGLIFGDIQTGIFLGAVFQLIFLAGLPIGRDVPPDAQGAGIAGCGAYFLLSRFNNPDIAIFISILVGIFASIWGSVLDVMVRYYNEKLYHYFLRKISRLAICHLAGIFTAFLRGIFLFLPIFILATTVRTPDTEIGLKKELLIAMITGIGMANGIYLFLKRRNIIFFFIGLLCSLVLFAF